MFVLLNQIHTRLTFFEALCDYKILDVLQEILIDNEKQTLSSIKSNESINESSSFFKQPIIEEPPKINEESLKKNLEENTNVNTGNKNYKIEKEDYDEGLNKLNEIQKVKPISVDNNEEELDIKEKIRINSIEILINIVTLMPSKLEIKIKKLI